MIIAEPVRNLASSRLSIVARLGAGATATADGAQARRFDAASLKDLMDGDFGDAIAFHAAVPGGREHLYVLTGAAGAARA